MKLTTIIAIPLLLGELSSAADLYVSDFSTPGVGSTHDTGADPLEASPIAGDNWSIFWNVDPASDGSTNRFITEDGLLVSEDWGGEAFFETEEIDVSGEATVNIVTVGSTRGSAVFNNTGTEQFQWYYVLDGVRVDGPVITADGSLDYSTEVDVSGASTLKVGFGFNVNGSGDGFEIVSVEVNDGIPTPEINLALDPKAVDENGGTSTVTVTLSAAPTGNLVLNLDVDDPTEASVPATVTINSGSLTGSFQVTGVDDALSDGPQVVTLSVVDPGGLYEGGIETFVVTDDEPFTPPNVVLNEIRINASNVFQGNGEYFELKSTDTNASLDRVFLVAIGDGTASQGSGVVEEVIDLTGQTMNGSFFVAADPAQNFVPAESIDLEVPLNFENDNVTFVLVSDFAAVLGDDLDVDDDGVLDLEPWGSLLDAVSLVSSVDPTDVNDLVYAGTLDPAKPVVGPDSTFIPAHVYRSSTNPESWLIGLFFADDPDNADTPGSENGGGGGTPVDSELQINSFVVDLVEGRGAINATGLGTKVWTVESSTDLGQTAVWTEVAGGVSENDQPDGSVDLVFFFSPGSASAKRFYRLVEVAN